MTKKFTFNFEKTVPVNFTVPELLLISAVLGKTPEFTSRRMISEIVPELYSSHRNNDEPMRQLQSRVLNSMFNNVVTYNKARCALNQLLPLTVKEVIPPAPEFVYVNIYIKDGEVFRGDWAFKTNIEAYNNKGESARLAISKEKYDPRKHKIKSL